MRAYIPKKTLDITLHELVELQKPDLLEACLELSEYYQNARNPHYLSRGKIEILLSLPQRLVMTVFHSLLTGWALILLFTLFTPESFDPIWMIFLLLVLIWSGYLGYECFIIFKYWRKARSYILVDELIARGMIQIGMLS